jgi:hypothetical protein
MRSPPAPDLPQLLRSPSLHAVPSTPVDRIGACRFLPHSRGLPRLTGGSASTTFTFEACSGFTRVTACKVAARPTADSCPEASTRPVTRPDRSVATMSYRQLHRWILLPPVICAVGAHVESRKGAVPSATARARFPSPLIKPDVPFSSIRLSDRIHHQLTEGFATKRRSTPSFPNTTRSEYLAVPSEGTLWRRLRNTLTDS